jgi:hypothetical protein
MLPHWEQVNARNFHRHFPENGKVLACAGVAPRQFR